ncbi:uncharacterized protein LOC126896990 isoform X2 [Daktulosphaira vitifoliae]|uniref:uncharacterized protein LOC126896990 isoform X2 n=1 Tax=Daktulosphaira vitifoliae TaxID=58002 RepID=UPI0021AA2D31|nr:uncharacterized protein LOC126896990 isoform X2 [Daktulosphaira vitifoliae]
MIKNRCNALNLRRCFFVILISAQIFYNTNASPEIQPPDYDTIFDDSFLQVIITINNNIKSFVCEKNQRFIKHSFINKDDIKLLSRSCEDNYECRQKKESSLNKLKKELESLECFHTFLCLQILEVLKNDIRIKNLNPNHTLKITFLDASVYVVRMISFFIYGKFVVNPWQYNFAKRLIDLARLKRQKKDTLKFSLEYLDDSVLLSSMNEFCENCKKTNELYIFQEKINKFLNKKNFNLHVKNLMSKTSLPCITNMNKTSHTLISKANQKEMVIDKDYENIKKVFLQSLKLNKYDDEIFKKNEIHFFNKDLWEKLRNKRLSSSRFRCACSFNQTKNNEQFLKKTLRIWNKKYENSDTKDNILFPVQYGTVNEPKAIELFEKKMDVKIEMCHKFIDEKINYLTAKPSGFIKKVFLQSLKLNNYDDELFKKNEIHFVNKDIWEKLRNKRLTSSRFYCACSFNQTKNKDSFLKRTLHVYNEKSSNTKNNIHYVEQYGIVNELKAIQHFEKKMDVKIEPCSAFIDKNINYLTAKPDGIIGKDGIVEIKCPVKVQYMTPEDAIKNKVINYVHYNKNEELVLKCTSDTFYQIQGELHITQWQYCYLIIWTPKGIVYCKIIRDDKFWNDNMEPKLIYFYEDFMLPELLNIHLTKDLNITNI